MKKMHSLSVKVPIMVSSIIVVTILVLSIILTIAASRGIRNATLNGFQSTVQGYASTIELVLHEQLVLIETYSKSATFQNFITNYNDIETRNNLVKVLENYNNINYYSTNTGIATVDGIILADSSDPKLVGVSLADIHPELYQSVVKNNYDFEFDNIIKKSLTTGRNSLLLMGGIKDDAGNVLGIAYINLDIDKVNNSFIKSLPLQGSERLTVANHDKMVLLSSDDEFVGATLSSVYDVIKTQDRGIIPSYKSANTKTARTSAYNGITGVPWSVILAKNDSDIYSQIYTIILEAIIIGVISIIIASILVLLYIRSITNPLQKIIQISKEISKGDLTNTEQTIHRKDELGELADSFTIMRQELVDIIIRVRDSVEKITNSAHELSQGSNDLSHRTESQAASLEETASSMEEMASTIKSSTDQSVQGNRMMVESRQSIESAGDIILETTRNIEEVYEASTKIKDITNIIENIAFQTNILALNAAVEAARAGDQGKGFAVVASEVRNLAQTTQSSVKDITNLVDNAYDKINKATDSARTSQEIFNDLRVKIDETARIMQDISSTAVEQQTGVDQVNRAVADMDSVTQQNAALVEESYAATMSLSNQAQELYEAMKFFKIDKDDKIDE
ncbi:methyl-accepting chemotaxis protein B [Brachyspira pilosicoli WesB]|uniref:Methyl-accepting chemotaxis protein B n=2 Tax=Brachyspira pilosicoli TaxID=52584 RepID=K0JJ26_BRAPL|nr:methyl-accepting chemotaxis protein [Brachyspira pilosicoli]AFR69934.1 methyl-accepting chemotaxis protein B [Brachyspira pilosicoli B2904]CCG56086.1 methyl-accepting chemotaxis protein B [Brachyspira pilosicoli WesB]